MPFPDIGFAGTCTVVQEEAFAASDHWPLVMNELDDFRKKRLRVVTRMWQSE